MTNPDTSLLYGRTENRLTLVGQNNWTGIRVTSSKKSQIDIQKNSFISILPAINEGVDTLRLFKGSKLLLSRGYRIVKLSDPIAQLAFTSDTIITKNRILANPFVTSKFPNSLYNNKIVVKSFECLVIKRNGEKKVFSATGNKLSEGMINAIKNLSSLDELVFDNIKAGISPVFRPKALPSFKVKIQ
ncbi:GldM family protein [Segetibacter sp. 3557_3]|uniref:GldM family protein n=1 Tax=Segetibacter sp. 3557_3 TaxID=2547429 RepID=UPI0014051450|nr:GldM family protein [Segetibacter sp. 3557_3]